MYVYDIEVFGDKDIALIKKLRSMNPDFYLECGSDWISFGFKEPLNIKTNVEVYRVYCESCSSFDLTQTELNIFICSDCNSDSIWNDIMPIYTRWRYVFFL